MTSLRLASTSAPSRLVRWLALRGLAVVEHAAVDRSEKSFLRGGIVDSARDGLAVFDDSRWRRRTRESLDELARAIERIDDPDSLLVEARRIVGGFLREPAFAVTQQVLAQDSVDGAVGFGDGIVSGFVFGCDCAGSEAGEDFAGCVEGGLNALQNIGVCSLS